jgi:hypothetical protein
VGCVGCGGLRVVMAEYVCCVVGGGLRVVVTEYVCCVVSGGLRVVVAEYVCCAWWWLSRQAVLQAMHVRAAQRLHCLRR